MILLDLINKRLKQQFHVSLEESSLVKFIMFSHQLVKNKNMPDPANLINKILEELLAKFLKKLEADPDNYLRLFTEYYFENFLDSLVVHQSTLNTNCTGPEDTITFLSKI